MSLLTYSGRREQAQAPLFTRNFVVVCLVTLLASSAQYLLFTALPLFLKEQGLGTELIGVYFGAFGLCALATRLPIGGAVDRFGARFFGWSGAGLLGAACAIYALIPSMSLRLPMAGAVPLLLPIAVIAHSVGFSSYGTSMSSFIAYTAPPERRGEAMGYYGMLVNVAISYSAALSLVVVANWGFLSLFATGFVMSCAALGLALCLRDTPHASHGGGQSPAAMRIDASVLPPALANMALAVTSGAGLAFVALLGLERGISNPGIYFSVVATSQILFRLVAGKLVDRFGYLVSAIPGMLSAAAGLVLVSTSTSIESLVLAGLLYGIGTGSSVPAFQALAIALADPARRGTAMATYWAILDIGASLGSMAAGQLVQWVGLGGVFLAVSSAPLIGLGGFLGYARVRGLPRRI